MSAEVAAAAPTAAPTDDRSVYRCATSTTAAPATGTRRALALPLGLVLRLQYARRALGLLLLRLHACGTGEDAPCTRRASVTLGSLPCCPQRCNTDCDAPVVLVHRQLHRLLRPPIHRRLRRWMRPQLRPLSHAQLRPPTHPRLHPLTHRQPRRPIRLPRPHVCYADLHTDSRAHCYTIWRRRPMHRPLRRPLHLLMPAAATPPPTWRHQERLLRLHIHCCSCVH